ncbi:MULTISPECIES: 30S ribosomal protein S9 [Mesotoga]|jgi:small subunit ribosomal protein S9|uniref:30S ribosomal protein S9 n=1 Tax=Mesotoga TaxID=1184396 RepID=UPI0002CC4683|nr:MULTISPECIES: 30S ribosomal protein S9 [Mesotoga]MCP5457364.1 30S ribosomal protein S9 [Thermotogota bacterium]CCU83560.1 30S ribosomal protein S9 [Mesotoga infera]MCP5460730.1 30S ribosomal protein S9 [Thermotogota bacterium]RLL85973.1 30S ribosomal protein S9 [Mesotoga sp. H07pep.5.4]HNQ70949.1 30S ribosomal protein S9 [Mesotoga prima]
MADFVDYYGTGRRKTSVARVHLRPGTGKLLINGKEYKDLKEYLSNDAWVRSALKPAVVTNTIGRFDMIIRVNGGGLGGQAGAISLGIARALVKFNPDLKKLLRQNSLLTRDPREVERKKYGLKKARRAPQFSKR